MTALEKEIEHEITTKVKQFGGLCLKWVCPGWAGVPDRLILMPGGLVYFVELKRPKGGKLSKLQIWWHHKLRELGFWVLVVKDPQDIKTAEMVLRLESSIINKPEGVQND